MKFMMKTPLISLLIPVYGVEKYIERCVKSLFDQTYGNIEYIFVDDCTKDRSIEIIKKIVDLFPERKENVKIIHHECNQGLTAARATALENATGEYVWHIDSDDWIAVDAVEQLVFTAIKNQADMVVFDALEVYANKNIEIHNVIPLNVKSYVQAVLMRQCRFELCFRFCKRIIYRNLLFDLNIGYGEDYAIVPRLVYNVNTLAHLDKICYYYNKMNVNSYTQSLSIDSVKSLDRAMALLETYFRPLDDGKWIPVLSCAKAYLKSHLLKSSVHNREARLFANRLYEEENLSWLNIKTKDKIVLWLSEKHLYWLQKMYIMIGISLKNIIWLR